MVNAVESTGLAAMREEKVKARGALGLWTPPDSGDEGSSMLGSEEEEATDSDDGK
jgi:hypothetical protein